MKHILVLLLMATVSFVGVGMVSAEDLVATWSMKDGPFMTIELQDQDNFRMNMGKDAYILMSQGKGYMVSKEKGEWVATSMEAMKKMMESSGIQDLMSQMGKKPAQNDRPPRFEKTGRVETIAGIKGQVYMVSMENAMGKPETVEMVFGEDSRLVRLHQAQTRWAESSGIMSGQGKQSYKAFIKKIRQEWTRRCNATICGCHEIRICPRSTISQKPLPRPTNQGNRHESNAKQRDAKPQSTRKNLTVNTS